MIVGEIKKIGPTNKRMPIRMSWGRVGELFNAALKVFGTKSFKSEREDGAVDRMEFFDNIICELPCVKSSCLIPTFPSDECACDGNDVVSHFVMSVEDLDGALDELVTRSNCHVVNDKNLIPVMIDEKELFIAPSDGSKGVTSIPSLIFHTCGPQ